MPDRDGFYNVRYKSRRGISRQQGRKNNSLPGYKYGFCQEDPTHSFNFHLGYSEAFAPLPMVSDSEHGEAGEGFIHKQELQSIHLLLPLLSML